MATPPLDVLLLIACYLDTEDLINACAISKAWFHFVSNLPFVFGLEQEQNFQKPSPYAVLSRLKGVPIKSLHLSGPKQYVIQTRPAHASHGSHKPFFNLFKQLSLQNRSHAFHLIVDGFEGGEVMILLHTVITRLSATRLSIGAFPVYSQLADLAVDLSITRWQL